MRLAARKRGRRAREIRDMVGRIIEIGLTAQVE
jgi:hypothetical protein